MDNDGDEDLLLNDGAGSRGRRRRSRAAMFLALEHREW